MTISNINSSQGLLHRLATTWDKRARVRVEGDIDVIFDHQKQDFLLELLPFYQHHDFIHAPDVLKEKILSCGWLIYNAKTIAIETDIVMPTCLALMANQLNISLNHLETKLITETLIDESYHIHICSYASYMTKKHRLLMPTLPNFDFIYHMQKMQSLYSEQWKKELIRFVTSITSEIYITDYLALISKNHSENIQPLNSLIVKTHRSDELVHGKIFTHFAKQVYSHLNSSQQTFFAIMLPKAISWLTNPEYAMWASLMKQLNFPHSEKIIRESMSELNVLSADWNDSIHDLVTLAEQMGILDTNAGKESFDEAGLLKFS